MVLEPKFKRPVKTANGWPGMYHLNFKHSGVQYPWKFQCPQPLCFYAIVAATEAICVQRIEEHPCPWYGGGTTTFSWGTMSDNYLKPIWDKLDAEVDIIKGRDPLMLRDDGGVMSQELAAAKHKARGLAEALAVLMPPFFTTGDEIVKEALVRHERRTAGVAYETPGLGRFKFTRPPGLVGDPDDPSWVTKAEYDSSDPKPAPKHSLSDEDVAKVKASAGFPTKMLAQAYGTSEAVIKYIQAN